MQNCFDLVSKYALSLQAACRANISRKVYIFRVAWAGDIPGLQTMNVKLYNFSSSGKFWSNENLLILNITKRASKLFIGKYFALYILNPIQQTTHSGGGK